MIFILAIKDMKKRWGLMVVLIGLFSIVFAAFIILLSHYKSASALSSQLDESMLVVGSSDGLSEIHGSRIGPAIKGKLISLGYTDPIPEIHQIVGTNLANGILIKGIRLEDYRQYNVFSMQAGRALEPGDSLRLAMVGATLAQTKGLAIGGDVQLRGRKFRIIGIFSTGSIQDNEAWVSLEDAQNLLNYGEDVSLYLIPDGGVLRSGELVDSDVLVSQRGESGGIFNSSVVSFLQFFYMIGVLVGIAAAITLGNMLFRLAYQRRHEFGILKAIGYGFKGLANYFFTQAGLIVLGGILIGIILSILIISTMITTLSIFGFGISTRVDIDLIVGLTTLALTFFSISSFLPLMSVYRQPIPDLLGRN